MYFGLYGMISIDLRIKSYKKLWIGKSNALHFTFIYDTSPISLNSPLSTNYQLILFFFTEMQLYLHGILFQKLHNTYINAYMQIKVNK